MNVCPGVVSDVGDNVTCGSLLVSVIGTRKFGTFPEPVIGVLAGSAKTTVAVTVAAVPYVSDTVAPVENAIDVVPATAGFTPTVNEKFVPETTVTELLPCPNMTRFPATVPISETAIETSPTGVVTGSAHVRALLVVWQIGDAALTSNVVAAPLLIDTFAFVAFDETKSGLRADDDVPVCVPNVRPSVPLCI